MENEMKNVDLQSVLFEKKQKWDYLLSKPDCRFTPLHMMGSLKRLGTMLPWCSGGFRAALNRVHMMPRGASLSSWPHTHNSFWNFIESNRNQIVFISFRLIWNQTESVRLVPNQLENGKYNLISVWFNKISKRFLRVYFLQSGS